MISSEHQVLAPAVPGATGRGVPPLRIALLPNNPWVALLVAWLVFAAVRPLVGALSRLVWPGAAWLPFVAVDIVLVAFALTASVLNGTRVRDLGFVRGAIPWRKTLALGLGLGMAATVVVLASGVPGLRPALKDFSFGQMVLFTWILSSVSEEIYCRGWFQTATMRVSSARFRDLLPSALLFGSLHLNLLLSGVDVPSVAILVPSVTLLGLLAAWARARSGSLYPAIAAHMAFNVGGTLGGIVYVVIYTAITGHMPAGLG